MASSSSPHHLGNPSAQFVQDKQLRKMIIPATDLNIVWGGDNRYWKVPKNENVPVVLHQVSWLEVTGSVTGTSPNKNYDVGFHVSLAPDAFGWGKLPIYIMVKSGKEGKFAWKRVLLNPNESGEFDITGKLMKAENQTHTSDDHKLYFGLYEVWSGKWKGGLKIHHVFVKESP